MASKAHGRNVRRQIVRVNSGMKIKADTAADASWFLARFVNRLADFCQPTRPAAVPTS